MSTPASKGTNSVSNWIMAMPSNSDNKPAVGMGCTILMWTDRYAATIVEVSVEGKKRPFVIIQEDNAKRTDKNGFSESQTYEYEANPNAQKVKYTLRKDRSWVKDGEPLRGGQRISIGQRRHYHDFSF